MKLIRLLFVFISFSTLAQQGGMWIPSMLEGDREKEMKKLGMKISASDIYNHNQSSIKDAIAHFDGGCTSEIISPNGLLLTNHHCGYGEIQSHSSLEHDYLQDGFWAKNYEEELPNPNMTVTLINKIEDVTHKILRDTENLTDPEAKQRKIQQNISELSLAYPKEAHQTINIRSFFEGNQFLLFVTEVFKDIRLVGAPPSSIGKFGSDTDNWVWPRHTGDFSLFRIYAGKDNKPAAYSKDNIPYKPKHFLPISLDGIEQDDFTMVFGFPGRTSEYLPSFAVAQIINDLNPIKIEIRDNALKVIDGYMRADRGIKIQYASKYASIANAWKKWIGENQGLKRSNALTIKRNFEKDFTKRMNLKGAQNTYGKILSEFEQDYAAIQNLAIARDIFVEIFLRNVELFNTGYRLYQLEKVFSNKGAQSFIDRKDNFLASLDGFYKDYNATVDHDVFVKLFTLYQQRSPQGTIPSDLANENTQVLADQIYKNSKLVSLDGMTELLSGKADEVIAKMNNDKGYLLVKKAADFFQNHVLADYEQINNRITANQTLYMKAILELFPDARIFPDANSTMRITYGKVDGYSPRDAVKYDPLTYLDGVIEKYIPGDYEFDVPQKLIELYNKKDYGNYAVNGKIPVNFIATNHTTGGNSGSPALDAHGNLIGLNFDRVWEGTMSDVYYDPTICRNIMVDIRYVLFIVDKYAGAQNLIQEMKIVHPKKSKKRK